MEELINYLLVVFICAFSAAGCLSFKKGVECEKLRIRHLIYGVCFYGVSISGTIYMLQRVPLSEFFPITAVTYIWTALFAKLFLREKISRKRMAGIGLIGLGVIMMGLAR